MPWHDGDLMEVEWEDAHNGSDPSGLPLSEVLLRVKNPLLRRDYGVLLFQDEARILISPELRGDDDLGEALFMRWVIIPRGMVRAITVFQRKNGVTSEGASDAGAA